MKKTKSIITIFLIIFMCLNLAGCKKDEKEELKEKVISELGYVNIKILDMLNALNNINFENYTIISEEVKLEDNSQKQQSGGKQQEESGNSGSSQSEQNQEDQEQNSKQDKDGQNLINTTEMTIDSILMKDRNNIDWQIIIPEIELLNESWSIIVLDLYSLNTNGDTILDFSSKINDVMVAMKNQDKQASLTTLAALYNSLPEFLKQINADQYLQKIRQTQSYVINAYILADNIQNPEINANIQKAVDTYSKVVSNIDYTKDKTYKTNKVYVLLNELANSLATNDSDIFYVKYKNFMEAINEL